VKGENAGEQFVRINLKPEEFVKAKEALLEMGDQVSPYSYRVASGLKEAGSRLSAVQPEVISDSAPSTRESSVARAAAVVPAKLEK